MANPLVIAALSLVGISAAGLHIDTRAVKTRQTRSYGVSALAVKALLLVAVVAEAAHLNGMPSGFYDQFGHRLTLFSTLAVGIPLIAVAIGCEIAAWVRFRTPPPRTHHVEDEPAVASAAESTGP